MSQDQSTADDRPMRALLAPAEWLVICPACAAANDIEHVREDDAGAFCADGPDQFFHCRECDTFLEVVAVGVTEAYPA